MDALPRVFVIVLNYNSAQTLSACLRSIFTSHGIDMHVVIVDNHSSDTSIADARTLFPRTTLIRNKHNVGFAAGNNVGIRFALEQGADFITLVNSDATITATTIETLVAAATTIKTPSVLCPLIAMPNGKLWYAGAHFDWWRMRAIHEKNPRSPLQPYQTESATGCVVCIHKDVFAKIGLLNESYFLYYEDADFSFCARKNGFFVGVVPTAHALHQEVSEQPARRNAKTYWLVLSALLFFRTHGTYLQKAWYTLFVPLRRIKNAWVHGRDTALRAQIGRAYKDYDAARNHYTSHC